MPDIERFLQERLNPLYRLHYSLWVYWWPLWRSLYSECSIRGKWEKNNLVQEGQVFLDYGCGSGSFTIPVARMVGVKGKVYALDCFPRQLEIVAERSRKAGLVNIETMLSNRQIGLPDECIDVVWMCDVLHELSERRVVLEEVYRVLKTGGMLAIYDGMKERILDYTDGLFSLTVKDGKFYGFIK